MSHRSVPSVAAFRDYVEATRLTNEPLKGIRWLKRYFDGNILPGPYIGCGRFMFLRGALKKGGLHFCLDSRRIFPSDEQAEALWKGYARGLCVSAAPVAVCEGLTNCRGDKDLRLASVLFECRGVSVVGVALLPLLAIDRHFHYDFIEGRGPNDVLRFYWRSTLVGILAPVLPAESTWDEILAAARKRTIKGGVR
jgi:hypothetical protein